MEEPRTPAQTIPHPPESPALSSLPGAGWPAWRWLALLLLVATALRVWQVRHTEVISRDSVGFIRVAWRLGHEDWRLVLRTSGQHPAYPLTVLGLSVPVRHFYRGDLADAMQLSAQLAGALAGVLLVVPMFYLGVELFDSRVGFWAALLFQCLPPSGRLLGDGLSEPLFLFLCAASLGFACRALHTGWRWGFACAGLAGGLAYLTRPEGALVPLSAGLILLGMQLRRGWRRPWRGVLTSGLSLSLPALAVALPYMAVIGGLSAKPSVHRLGTHPEHHPGPGWAPPKGDPRAEAGATPAPLTFSTVPWVVWDLKSRNPAERSRWAFYALGVTLVRGSVYVLWLPALFGLVWFRDRFRLVPGAWVALVLSLLLTALLYRVAQVMGYLDERHLMLAVLCGTYWTVAALAVTGTRLAGWLERRRPGWSNPWGVTLLLLLALACLPLFKTLRTLNRERAGFRQAGAWLADHARPDDEVVDPYTWAGYYAGRVFLEGRPPAPGPHACYVVLEDGASKHDHLWWVLDPVLELVKGVEPVKRFGAPRRGKPDGALLIYKLDRP